MAGTVTATMIYNADLPIYKKEKLYASNIPCPPGVPTTNHRGEFRDGILITDMRHDLKGYHLDKQGFEVVRHGLRIDRSDFEDDAWVEHNYYPIIEEMLQNRLGNVRVQIFDHTVRKRDPTVERGAKGFQLKRQPALCAHIDQTFLSGVNRVKLHMGQEAPLLLQKRYQIINVWRPLFGPLEDFPLAVCDYRTLDINRDCMAADLVFPHYIGEQWYCKYNQSHAWHYLSHQETDEFLLFKCYESSENGVARCVPHASFSNPLTPKNARPRESIEVRCLVFYN